MHLSGSVWYHFILSNKFFGDKDEDINLSFSVEDRKNLRYHRSLASRAFNPFENIELSVVDNSGSSMLPDEYLQPRRSDKVMYSSHHCVISHAMNATTEETRFVTRTCRFNNLYFHPAAGKFHYFPSPLERDVLGNENGAWDRLVNDMTVAMGNVRFIKKLEDVPQARIWHPVVERYNEPPETYAKIATPSNLALLLYRPFYSHNPGHFIWDDALSLFSMLDIFGMGSSSDRIFPLPFYVDEKRRDGQYFKGNWIYQPCDVTYEYNDTISKARWSRCTRMYKRLFPELFRYETHVSGDILRSGNWLKGQNQEWRGFNSSKFISTSNQGNTMPSETSFVLIPLAVGGTGRLGQLSCSGDCAIGRSSQFQSFKHFLLGNIFWPDYDSIQKEIGATGPAGYITFSLPTGSSRPEEVDFFERIIPVAKRFLGEDKVIVVDMSSLSMREEAIIALNTAVLFVNHGGGSVTSVFLPVDSSVFIYSNGKCSKGPFDWCDDGKNHFDNIFYNSNGSFRHHWIEPEDRNKIEKVSSLLQMEYEQTMHHWAK